MRGKSCRRAAVVAALAVSLISPGLWARTASAPAARPAAAPAAAAPLAVSWLDALRGWVHRLLAGSGPGAAPAAEEAAGPPPAAGATVCGVRGGSTDPDGSCHAAPPGGG
jgi:hypothetical protein